MYVTALLAKMIRHTKTKLMCRATCSEINTLYVSVLNFDNIVFQFSGGIKGELDYYLDTYD